MRCDQATNQLVSYALDELLERERREIRAHLSECASCRAELHAQERTLAALSRAQAPAPTPAMQRDLLHVLRQRQAEILEAQRRAQERWEAALFTVTAAGVLSAVAFVGFMDVRILLLCLSAVLIFGASAGGLMLAILAARSQNFGGER